MKDLIRMIAVLTAICIVAALALAQVFAVTKTPIEEAKRAEKLKAIRVVLPEFDNEPDKDVEIVDGRSYYPAIKDGRTIAYAFEASSTEGYSGEIKVLVGVLLDGEVWGLEILDHKETPGLGQKIEQSEWRDRVVYADNAKTTRRTLENTTWSVQKDGGDIDQISGATISPRAVVNALFEAMKLYETDKTALGRRTGAQEAAP